MDSGCVHVNFSGSKISASTLLSALITVYALREVKTNVRVCVCVCVCVWVDIDNASSWAHWLSKQCCSFSAL